jgi:hypothetical protein
VKAGQPVPAEALSEAARYRTYERWGTLDIRGVEDTVRPRSREHDAAQLFAACMAVSEGYVKHVRHGERMRLRGGYRTSARGLEIKAICANVTVRHFGLDLKAMSAACEAGLNPLKGWPTLPIQTLKEITKGGPPIDPRLLRSLGLDQKAKETAMQYLQRILRMLGLKAKGRKVRCPDGTRTRNYTLDLDAAQEWIERTSRYYTRTTGRPVDAPESLHMWVEHPPEVYEALLPVPVKVVL